MQSSASLLPPPAPFCSVIRESIPVGIFGQVSSGELNYYLSEGQFFFGGVSWLRGGAGRDPLLGCDIGLLAVN